MQHSFTHCQSCNMHNYTQGIHGLFSYISLVTLIPRSSHGQFLNSSLSGNLVAKFLTTCISFAVKMYRSLPQNTSNFTIHVYQTTCVVVYTCSPGISWPHSNTTTGRRPNNSWRTMWASHNKHAHIRKLVVPCGNNPYSSVHFYSIGQT